MGTRSGRVDRLQEPWSVEHFGTSGLGASCNNNIIRYGWMEYLTFDGRHQGQQEAA